MTTIICPVCKGTGNFFYINDDFGLCTFCMGKGFIDPENNGNIGDMLINIFSRISFLEDEVKKIKKVIK